MIKSDEKCRGQLFPFSGHFGPTRNGKKNCAMWFHGATDFK